VPALVESLGDANVSVREQAVRALAKFGGSAKAAVPDLLKAVRDREDRVREFAQDALEEIDPEAAAKADVK